MAARTPGYKHISEIPYKEAAKHIIVKPALRKDVHRLSYTFMHLLTLVVMELEGEKS